MKAFKDKHTPCDNTLTKRTHYLYPKLLHCVLKKLHKDLYIQSLRNCYAFLKSYYNRNFLGGGDYCTYDLI